MAQTYVTDSGTLVIPGAYPIVKVQNNNSGLSTTGVLVLIGEADAGPDFSLESDISTNFFGPDQLSDVISKYKSGNIVDAFRAASNPADDTNITGSPAAIYVVKTNVSTKGSAALVRAGLSNYGVLADKSWGSTNTYFSVSGVAPVAPTTGPFTYVPGPNTGGSDGSTLAVRVNGGSLQTAALAHLQTPPAFVTALNALTGVLATGGQDRTVLTGMSLSSTLALVATGNSVTITTNATAWNATPSVGDLLVIPVSGEFGAGETSCVVGAANANAGQYVVTAVTATTVTALKLHDHNATGITSPVNVSAAALGSEATDLICYAPVTAQVVAGTDRAFLTGLTGKTVAGTATGQSLKLTLQTGSVWAALPQVGDLVVINGSAPAGILASGANTGWYQVTAATSGAGAGQSTLTMTRLSNGAPATFSPTALAATTDLQDLRPAVDGLGKSLVLQDGNGNINVNTLFYALSSTAVTWLNTAGTPQAIYSTQEYAATLNVTNLGSGVQESFAAGGIVALRVAYLGTTATLTVGPTTITTSVVGGAGVNLSLKLSDFKTLADLAQFINSQTGYVCKTATSLMGQLSPLALDEGTYGIASSFGELTGQIKKDASDFFNALSKGSGLAQLGLTAAAAASGVPEVQAVTYFQGGAKGASAAAQVQAAVDVCSQLRANFIVPLFSRDAAADAADDLTDAASTYSIDAINAAVSSHVLAMSKLKSRRQRQGFVSKRDTFKAVQQAAQNIANYRCDFLFQDVKVLNGQGVIQQYQPWMLAVLAAGMQAAGFYRSILFKHINCTSVLMWDGSMHDSSDADLEAAINNGLLAAQKTDTGGFRWNSDQTTYAVDGSFVYNSTQAIYASDTIALTVASRMEKAFVGQSVADVSASVVLSYLQGIMADMKRLKLIASSDDAPAGYKNVIIKIAGNALVISLEIKLAGAIVFAPITFLVTQVQQSAAA